MMLWDLDGEKRYPDVSDHVASDSIMPCRYGYMMEQFFAGH
jgi:hypothetical protein